MSDRLVRSLFRPIILTIVLFLVLASWNRHGSSRDTTTMAPENVNQHAGALSHLTVRIRQSSTAPPTLALSVTNEYTSPLTILRWDTPLDPLALQLGVLSVTAEGATSPLEIPIVQLRRLMPPPQDDIITLQPGERKEQEVILRDTILPFDKLGKTARVAAKGKWRTVWPTTADKLSEETIQKLQFGDGVLTGEFETEAVDVTIA